MKKLSSLLKKIIVFGFLLAGMSSLASCGTKVTISETSHTLKIGEQVSLVANSSDEDALVLWETSDKNIATVRKGIVTAVSCGECVVKAYDDCGAFATCAIKVTGLNISISHTYKEVDISKLNTFFLMAEAEDGGAITWTSSNTSIATVNDGYVTCYQTGTVKIKAGRDDGLRICTVNVIDTGARPSDYYEMVQGMNSVVVSDPGVWYFNPNTGDTVSKATYQNKGFTASITELTSSGGVQFRYQPGGKDKTGLAVGDQYTISFQVKLNIDGKVNYNTGKSNATVTANTFSTITFTGTVDASTPFNISVKNLTVPASGSIDITVQNITISSNKGEDYYQIIKGTNAIVSANPGVWYYNNNDPDVVDSATYNNGGFVAKLSVLTSTNGTQFRYQPGGSDQTGLQVGDKYKINLTVKLNVDGTVYYNSGKSNVSVTANTEKEMSHTGTVTDGAPFNISLKNMTIASGSQVILTVTKISVIKISNSAMEVGTMATVKANPGKWYYNSKGSATFGADPTQDSQTGDLSVTVNNFDGDHFYFRYQPGGNDGTGCVAGDAYVLSFTLNVSKSVTVNYGTNGNKSVSVTANTDTPITYNGIVNADQIFYIKLAKDLSVPISMTVKSISITKGA